MVGRLIQQQEVIAAQHQLQQRHTRTLTAGTHGQRPIHLFSLKQERRQRIAHAGLRHLGKGVPHLADHRFRQVQLGLHLVKVAGE